MKKKDRDRLIDRVMIAVEEQLRTVISDRDRAGIRRKLSKGGRPRKPTPSSAKGGSGAVQDYVRPNEAQQTLTAMREAKREGLT